MTQQEQNEFRESWEDAQAWMQVVQERLKLNDNTAGPRADLEARLRETEKIHESEQEGRMKMDLVLVAADALLKNGDEELRNQTHSKLKELKTLWEETSTYIVHCHSRIEWVWLHWNEYLKAHEDFSMWLVKAQRVVEPQPELQLGLREKLWQVEHRRVTCSDVKAQKQLLERLLDEAATLYNRTQDPSVDESAQNTLQEEYDNVRAKAEDRLAVVHKVAEEHQRYQGGVRDFQEWLVLKTEEASRFTEIEDDSEDRLRALQDLDACVAREEETLLRVESEAEAVKANTSPAGAELITEETEELRSAWQKLRVALVEIHAELKASADARREYHRRREDLAEAIKQLRGLVHEMSLQLENRDGERSEENIVAQWKIYTNVRTVLSAEEPQVEELKDQLKELYRFPHDSQELADEVLAVVKEYQSVKGRAFRLCSESETSLKQVLQDPLYVFSQWNHQASQMIEASAEVSDFDNIAVLVQNIEKLLKDSVQLQERLSLLQAKADLLSAVFGEEKAQGLLEELGADMRKREQLHSQLLQRRTRLQGLLSTTKSFGDAHDSIQLKLTSIEERLHAADGLQPDILAKKSQADQLKVIKKDLEDCEAHMAALEMLVSSSAANRTRFERLYSDWKLLYKAVRTKVNESEKSVSEHENFHESLLNMEKWLMIMRQKLESFRAPDGKWSVENREHEAARALGEFPEKELQLHKTEVQGQAVLQKTSEEGKVHIQRDLRRLRESWMSLHELSLNLHRLLNGEIDSSVHSRHATDFLEGSAGSTIRISRSGFQDDLHLDELRASGGFGAFVKSGKPVTRHDDASQTEDVEFQGGFLNPEDIQGVWRGEPRGRFAHGTDRVDSVAAGRGYQGVAEQKDGGRHARGAGAGRRVGSRNGRRTYNWGEEQSSGFEDVQQGEGGYASGAAKSSDVGPKQPSAFTHVVDASGHGSKGITQVKEDWKSRRREFDAWLHKESEKLAKITNDQRAPSSRVLKMRRNTLKGLRAGIPWGQDQFQQLLSSWQANAGTEDVDL